MKPDPKQYIYTDGCIKAVEAFLQTNMKYLAGGTIGFLLILVSTIPGLAVMDAGG